MVNTYIADPHQKRLLKKWSAILECGKPIESDNAKLVLAQVLENTYNFYRTKGMLNEAGVAGTQYTPTVGPSRIGPKNSTGVLQGGYSVPYQNGEYGDYYLPNVVMPMLRRIMPDLIANDLVGVQPLNGPVGFALAYRPTYGVNGGHLGEGGEDQDINILSNQNEIGFNPTITEFTGKNGPEVPAGITEDWEAYAGKSRWNGVGQDTATGEYAALGENYGQVSFQLVKSAVEAKTRKLAAHWSPELAEDMQAMHGIDVEKEMVNTLTYEVGAEIDRQIVSEMVKAALIGGNKTQWSPATADGLDQMGRLQTLLTQITIEANNIAVRTRRGNANFVVTTPRVCALLQQMGMNKYTSFKQTEGVPSTPDTGIGALTKVGLINDDSQLLVRDAYAANNNADYILLGYKGKQPGDSGIIYMPYIPLQLSKVMQPFTFTPSIGARTRYGLMSSPWDAARYYAFIKVTGLWDQEYNGVTAQRTFIAEPTKLDNVGQQQLG